MRSALYTGNGAIVVTDGEAAPPGPGQVRLDVAYTGICGTDLHVLHGDMDHRVTVPQPIGHEMSGRVAEIGPGVEGWSAGQPVTVMPLRSCGSCPACAAGHGHVCHRLDFVGIDSPGSMQESWTVPADLLVALPAGLSLRHAALVEPTAVAVHDVRRAGLVAGERAVVVGGGPVGVLIALVARAVRADVLLVEPDAHRRGVAAGLGLRVLDPGDDIAAAVDAWTAGAGADVSFEVSGVAQGVATGVEVLATRGRLVLVAIHGTPRPLDLHRFFWRELSLIGARVYTRDDVETAVDLVDRGEVDAGPLISHVVALSDAPRAFATLAAGHGAMKVLVECGGEAR